MIKLCGSFSFCISLLMSMTSFAADVVPGEYLVKFKGQLSPTNAMGKISSKASLKAQLPIQGMYHVQLKAGATLEDIASDPDVEYIEPNYILRKTDDPVGEPVDILSDGDMQALSSTSFTQNYAPVQMLQAWQVMKPFDDNQAQNRPVVAVIDTGLDYNHRVFQNSNAQWVNTRELNGTAGVDDDGNGYVDDIKGWNFITNTNNYKDDQGHGTHVSGIVVGTGIDILAGTLDPAKVQIMSLKFLDSTGSGSTSDGIRAIYYAVDNGAKVINCSWGGGSYSRSLQDAISYAYSNGVLVVSAAGNNTANNDRSDQYPANYDVPSNLSVAATTDADALAYFSNYGVSTVPLAAPGYQIYSTYTLNRWVSMSGTSMAAPFVAGIAAMGIREQPTIKGYQLKTLLESSVDVVGSLSQYVGTSGRVNAYKFIQSISNPSLVVASSQPNYVATYKAERSPSSDSASGSGGKGGCGLVTDISNTMPPGFGGLAGALLIAPFAFAYYLRRRNPVNKRKFERFRMESSVTIQSGDDVIVGSMKSISMGGVSFDAKAALEKGGKVTLLIENPDGGAPIEAEGHIVWSAQNQSYGVQFDGAREGLSSTIQTWCKSLVRQ